MALTVEIKINELIVEAYVAERVEELEKENYHYTYKAWKLIPDAYEAFTGKVARWKKESDMPQRILRHKYSEGGGKLAVRILKSFNK